MVIKALKQSFLVVSLVCGCSEQEKKEYKEQTQFPTESQTQTEVKDQEEQVLTEVGSEVGVDTQTEGQQGAGGEVQVGVETQTEILTQVGAETQTEVRAYADAQVQTQEQQTQTETQTQVLQDATSLAKQIREEAHQRGLISEVSLTDYEKKKLVPLFYSRAKAIVAEANLEKEGIKKTEDAFQKLGWIDCYSFDMLAERIRDRALAEHYISEKDHRFYFENELVPLFKNKKLQRTVYEFQLLDEWVLKTSDAFLSDLKPNSSGVFY